MATSSLGFDNFFSTTLNGAISDSDLTITLNAVPTASEGFLAIDPSNASKREVIYYTSKGASSVTVPSGAGNGRGYDGTTATSHSDGDTVIMAPVAAMWEALQDGTGLASGFKIGTTDAVVTADITDAAVTPDKMNFGAVTDMDTGTGTTTSTSYTSSLTTMGTMPAVTAVVPASGSVLVTITGKLYTATADQRAHISYSLSSGNTLSATDNAAAGRECLHRETTAAAGTVTGTWLHTGLTAGSTVFQMEALVQSSTGTFQDLSISVIPIGD